MDAHLKHISAISPTRMSTEEPHTLPAQRPARQSTACLRTPATFGTKQHKSVNRPGSSGASPCSVPINHPWQVAGKQLLMMVLLRSAGSHLLTLPAVVCLPEPWQKDRRGQRASHRVKARQETWSHTGQSRPKKKKKKKQTTTFRLRDACLQPFPSGLAARLPILSSSPFALQMQGTVPEDVFLSEESPAATHIPPCDPSPPAPRDNGGIYHGTKACTCAPEGLRAEPGK